MLEVFIKNKFLKKIDKKDANEILDFILKYQEFLTKDDIDLLIERVISLNDPKLIYEVSLKIKNLSNKNKNDLINALILTKNDKFIYLYACNI